MKKTTATQGTHSFNYINLIVAVLALMALAISVFTLARLQSYDANSTTRQLQTSANIARVSFCHDRQIIPCTDDNLTKWNSTHTDDTFNAIGRSSR